MFHQYLESFLNLKIVFKVHKNITILKILNNTYIKYTKNKNYMEKTNSKIFSSF